MNPLQLRETTMNKDTRRLVQLNIDELDKTHELMDMLLAKKGHLIARTGWKLTVILQKFNSLR